MRPPRVPPVAWRDLALHEARRWLSPATGVLVVLSVALGLVNARSELLADVPLRAGDVLVRGHARQTVAVLMLLGLGPLLLLRASTLPARWRARDADWLGARLPNPRGALLASLVGQLAAALVVLVVALVAMELAAGTGPAGLRPGRAYAHAGLVLAPGDREAACALRPPQAGASELDAGGLLELPLRVALGSGPTADLHVRLTRAGGGTSESTVHVDGPLRAHLPLPAPRAGVGGIAASDDDTRGHGVQLEVRITRVDGGATIILRPDAVRVLSPVGSERLGALALGLHALQLVLAWSACALGLGAFMRPALAGTLAFLLWLLPWWWALGTHALPAGDLWHAWRELGRGLVPAPPTLAAWGTTLLALALGWLTACVGLRHWRSTP